MFEVAGLYKRRDILQLKYGGIEYVLDNDCQIILKLLDLLAMSLTGG